MHRILKKGRHVNGRFKSSKERILIVPFFSSDEGVSYWSC